MSVSLDSYKTRRSLTVGKRRYDYFSLAAAEKKLGDLKRLPFSLKVLLENLLRYEDGRTVTKEDVAAVAAWLKEKRSSREIAFRPARVLMQDFTGVPAVVDLAAMRDAMVKLGGDPKKINPLVPVDLVIDHSVIVDNFGNASAFAANVKHEYQRNGERYQFLRWGQKGFDNFQVVPPGTGICHQVNLEYLAQVVWTRKDEKGNVAFPDTLVGTDSHTTMVNGLSVLGWGVGGIEAEACMLGQPLSMVLPEVIGFKLTGKLREGATATDLVLTVTQMLRKKGVVNKFVEFYGAGLDNMALADRATIANMAPEYGATCGFFPIDDETVRFLKATGRAKVAPLVEAYAKKQGLWRSAKTPDPVFTDTLELDLATVEPSLAGPKRPQDRVPLSQAAPQFTGTMEKEFGRKDDGKRVAAEGEKYDVGHGDVVIAAITSCTNTSNPSVMLGAGLIARNAVKHGLKVKPWVKTSLAPGSQVVTDYLKKAGLQDALNKIGFNLVGYGCTTCIGNSGPLPDAVSKAVSDGDLVVASVLSGNRNFEGRVNPQTRANFLASPMLVVIYALAGSMKIDITKDPIGTGKGGKKVYLKDLWPTNEEIAKFVKKNVTPTAFKTRYADVFHGDKFWRGIKVAPSLTYGWDNKSTYVQNPPYFEGMTNTVGGFSDIKGARVLALLGDSITTDHISPAGSIKKDSPAGKYLIENGVAVADFNQYGTRRGNHEVMMRGTFANIRIKNEMVPGVEGGVTKYIPTGETMPIYDAAMKYKAAGTPLVVIAGKEYGTGSSRDWAAKGTILLGVKAVITESFERIHRSNLVGMGVMPLLFKEGTTRKTLNLDGTEIFDITGLSGGIKPRMDVPVTIHRAGGKTEQITVTCGIFTLDEVEYFRNGGILHYVLRNLAKAG
ncbi:MAG TPA: aconitate hydratase AcnA [Hypericibacter adhaerens]|uniref:Aconitate hydratase n=1 Tax=Hypericibacter adhaerens TaxID=2602016 RepID=A0A5J6N652_9PROT|nr:aconitate hydratase AcnA [Hypericibacter adhaerens]QEX24937.1 aconitate hydratase [Hypericibacter adhaerens]HWA43846.1 aconitate hydratase AcnA [Hypericibacter adhaerens]